MEEKLRATPAARSMAKKNASRFINDIRNRSKGENT